VSLRVWRGQQQGGGRVGGVIATRRAVVSWALCWQGSPVVKGTARLIAGCLRLVQGQLQHAGVARGGEGTCPDIWRGRRGWYHGRACVALLISAVFCAKKMPAADVDTEGRGPTADQALVDCCRAPACTAPGTSRCCIWQQHVAPFSPAAATHGWWTGRLKRLRQAPLKGCLTGVFDCYVSGIV
jgi:hypothetical protein